MAIHTGDLSESWPLSLEPSRDAAGDGALILVVEDEPAVRRLVGDILVRQGYRLVQAGDGEAGWLALQENPEVALVVTDVRMPRLGGRELARRVQELRPHLPVLFMSGYTDGVLDTELNQVGRSFLAKPFDARALVEAVAGALRTGWGSGAIVR